MSMSTWARHAAIINHAARGDHDLVGYDALLGRSGESITGPVPVIMSPYQGPFFPFHSLSLLISFSVIVVSHGRVLTVMHYIIASLCGREYGECEPLLCDLCDAKWRELWVNGNKQRNPQQCECEYRFLVLEWWVLWAIQGHNWTLYVSSSTFWPSYLLDYSFWFKIAE